VAVACARDSAIAHLTGVIVVELTIHPAHETELSTVDIEMAPPPPKAEALLRWSQSRWDRRNRTSDARERDATAAAGPARGDRCGIDAAAPIDARPPADARPDAAIDASIDAALPMIAQIDGGVTLADGGAGGTTIAAIADAGIPAAVAVAGSGIGSASGSGSGFGSALGSGSGAGVPAAIAMGSGSGAPGVTDEPAGPKVIRRRREPPRTCSRTFRLATS